MQTNKNVETKCSRAEAGRLGGLATSKCHEKDFYQKIGKKGGTKGGKRTAQTHDMAYFQEIGRKGGLASSKKTLGS